MFNHGGNLKIKDVKLSYPLPDRKRLTVLDIDEFAVNSGSAVCIMGPSGSGKTSFLYALAGIEEPQEGMIQWGDVRINVLHRGDRDRWRQKNIGFVFQDFHLIPCLSPLENVLIPVYFRHLKTTPPLKDHARQLLKRVGLEGCSISVEKLSRGEMQRVAIARALIISPPVILADEPTGSLDRKTADEVMDLLLRVSMDTGVTLIVVAHDPAVIKRFGPIYKLHMAKLKPVMEA